MPTTSSHRRDTSRPPPPRRPPGAAAGTLAGGRGRAGRDDNPGARARQQSPRRRRGPGESGQAERSRRLLVERGGAIWPGRPGEIVRPGDTIQFTTTTDAPSFVAVLSVNGDGQVDLLYPEARKAAAVPAGREVGLPASTILDATFSEPRTDRRLLCDQAIELEPVRLALQAQPATLPPPPAATPKSSPGTNARPSKDVSTRPRHRPRPRRRPEFILCLAQSAVPA